MRFLNIFSAQPAMGYLMGTNFTLWWLFKEGICQDLMADFAAIFPPNPCNLGLECSIWTFSVINKICALGSCLKRVPNKAF